MNFNYFNGVYDFSLIPQNLLLIQVNHLRKSFQVYRFKGRLCTGKNALSLNGKYIKCAQQPSGVECCYYIMKYMLEIIKLLEEGKGELEKDYLPRDMSYSNEELDEVREHWANFVRTKYMS